MAGISMEEYFIYTDGAARGNPGASASGFIVIKGGRVIARKEVYNGIATNNYAEYNAIIEALKWCLENTDAANANLHVSSDSELVVRQLTGAYKLKSKALMLPNKKARELAGKFNSVSFNNVRREEKHVAAVDKAINVLLDSISKKTMETGKKEKY